MISRELREQVYNCIRCGLCMNSCPVYRQLCFEGASPRGKVQLIKKIFEGKLEISAILLPSSEYMPALRDLHRELSRAG